MYSTNLGSSSTRTSRCSNDLTQGFKNKCHHWGKVGIKQDSFHNPDCKRYRPQSNRQKRALNKETQKRHERGKRKWPVRIQQHSTEKKRPTILSFLWLIVAYQTPKRHQRPTSVVQHIGSLIQVPHRTCTMRYLFFYLPHWCWHFVSFCWKWYVSKSCRTRNEKVPIWKSESTSQKYNLHPRTNVHLHIGQLHEKGWAHDYFFRHQKMYVRFVCSETNFLPQYFWKE